MPRTYAVLDPCQDFRNAAREALQQSGADRLIMKPVTGSGGRGIACSSGGRMACILIRSRRVPLAAFRLKERYLVQEILTQDERVAQLYPTSVNTIRTLTLLTRSNEVLVASAVMRFGVGGAFVDNWSSGGIAIGVETADGSLMKWAYDKRGRRFEAHPTRASGSRDFRSHTGVR